MATPPNVSVIIPAYNAASTIKQVLDALTCQDYSENFEVIVVDDGSSDETNDIVSSFSSVRYVRQDNAGPASARNHGASIALGNFLVFTDSDCIAHPDWISKLMSGFFEPDIAVVAGSYGIANPESWLASCVHAEIIWRHTVLMPEFPNAFGSYNFCVRKKAFDSVGGFDAGFRRASGEDNNLSYKIVSSGVRIYFKRDALVDHYHPTDIAKYLKEQFRHGFWRVRMYQSHPGMMKGDGYTYWKDIAEMPWTMWICLGLLLSALGYTSLEGVVHFLILPFLGFEMLCGRFVTHNIIKGISFGTILFLRAFARMFGLSTGILSLIFKK